MRRKVGVEGEEIRLNRCRNRVGHAAEDGPSPGELAGLWINVDSGAGSLGAGRASRPRTVGRVVVDERGCRERRRTLRISWDERLEGSRLVERGERD